MWIVAWMATAQAADVDVDWTALAGVQSSFGTSIRALGNPREPATKVSVPIEANLGMTIGPGVLLRAHAGAGLLINGTFLYSTSSGDLVGYPHHVDLLASVGVRRAGWSGGLLGGLQFPTRPTLRGFFAWQDEDGPLTVELRGGINLPTRRPIEPVVQLSIGIHGPVNRRGG